MSIRIVQLGSRRRHGEGIRIGSVRRPPRGISKKDYERLDYYDIWLPELSPSPSVFKDLKNNVDNPEQRARSMRKYEKEMERPPASRIIKLLALLSHDANFSVGCYCKEEDKCHRSVLKKLLADNGARLA